MRNLLNLFIIYSIISTVVGCKKETTSNQSTIFDLQKEIAFLDSLNPNVKKTVIKNGKKETLTKKINWKNELKILAPINIPSKKLKEEYDKDVYEKNNKKIVTYSAKSHDTNPKLIQVSYTNSTISNLYLMLKENTRVSNSFQELYYTPKAKYHFIGYSNIRGIDKMEYEISGEILSNKKHWNAFFNIGKDILPIRLDITPNQLIISNADEKIVCNDVIKNNDTLIYSIPVFDSEFRLKLTDSTASGFWCNKAKGSYKIPFYADTKPSTTKFETPANFDGKWEVLFSPNSEDEYKAIGIFKQKGSKVTGTFLTETGDYRYLEGFVNGNQMTLSCFDGSHAFLFKATQNNGNLEGKFWSGYHWTEPWIATRNEKAKLSHPDSLTYLVNNEKTINFQLPDLDSNIVSLNDNKFKNKVTIVQLMGSWCPNCMDETLFLKDLYNDRKKDGLEIVALCFEVPKDFSKKVNNVKKLKGNLGADYTFLIAGKASKQYTSELFPQLNEIISYPTTLFIDKKGEVRKIHTGFYGPGTGIYYENFVSETTEFVNSLLEEEI